MTLVQTLGASTDIRQVGGKAANLARLLAADFPVPGGLVVTADAFRRAAAESGSSPQELPLALAAELTAAYVALGSPSVAVRSSATAEDLADASMAGQYETILDVQGAADVVAAVARCWRSIDTPRTRAYLAAKGIAIDQVAMAVVVQELVPSAVAGVLFTVNPRSGRSNEMLIEAAWGLGESVVGGLVQPDTLVVDRTTGAVLQAVIADKRTTLEPGSHAQREVAAERRLKPCLTAGQVDALRLLGERVATYFGSPQDLEWGIADGPDGGTVRLLQSRAITTLLESPQRLLATERTVLGAALAADHGPWVRHNLSETLPHPTPLSWSVVSDFMRGDGGFGLLYRQLGFEPSPAIVSHGFLRLIAGRIYQDLRLSPELFFAGYPFAYDLDLLRNQPDAAQEPPSLANGTLAERFAIQRRLRRVDQQIERLIPSTDHDLINHLVPKFLTWCAEERARPLAQLTASDLLACWDARRRHVLTEFSPSSLLPSVICATMMARLKTFLIPWCWDVEPGPMAELVSCGGPANFTVTAAAGLRDLAEGRLSIGAWLAEHGHRAPAEFDLATPRWHERPETLLTYAANLAGGADPLALHRERVLEAAAAAAALAERMPAAEQREFTAMLAILHRYLRFREDAKHWLMHGYALLRDVALEAGRRLAIGEQVFLLTDPELRTALHTGYAPLALLAQRRSIRLAEARCQLPALITAEEIPTLGQPAALPGGTRLVGFPIASGCGQGPVRIVLHPESTGGDLGRGYILVCPSTDPSWTPLFVNAAGLVLERGGALSHGAVVAREMGIPAVVLDGATTLLLAGESVAIDGERGLVCRISASGSATQPVTAAPDDTDEHIAHHQLPPAISRTETLWGRVRNLMALFWGIFLTAAFWPGTWSMDHLYRPTLTLLDPLLWPLVTSLGRLGAVAVVAGVMAVMCLVLQRWCTDHHRMVMAKERAAKLRAAALALPVGAPRRAALMRAANPVQWRIMGAAFVPLGLMLGPMIMSVFWLTDRIDGHNPPPGTSFQIIATLDGDYAGPVELALPHGVTVNHEITPAIQRLPPTRATLEDLAATIRADRIPDALPWGVGLAAESSRQACLASLQHYLMRPQPESELQWEIDLPVHAGSFEIGVILDGQNPGSIRLITGEDLPPPATELIERAHQPAKLLQVVRPAGHRTLRQLVAIPKEAQAQATRPPFLQPFRSLGWLWDPGWIVFYIAIYLPVMFITRWLLRVA